MTSVGPDTKGQGPPPAYPPPYGQPAPPGYMASATSSNTVVVSQHGLGAVNGAACLYNNYPQQIVCQHCHATVTTSTMYTIGTFTWLIALLILLFGFWLGCCLIPFCIDGCKDVIHTCPSCHCTVGRFSRI